MTRGSVGLALAAILGASTLAACGGSSSHAGGAGSSATAEPGAQTANSSGNGSFLGRASNAVVFVQWTRGTGGQLTGTLYQAIEHSQSGSEATVEPQNTGFTGTINGASLTLALNGGSNLTGTLTGSNIELNYPGNRGGITTIQMHQATSGEYNRALEALKGQAGRENTSQQASHDAQAVANDIKALDTEANTAGGAGASTDLTQMRHDLATTLSAEQKVLGEASNSSLPPGQCGSDAGEVGADAGTVGADLGTVEAAQGNNGASGIESAIAHLQQDAGALGQLRSTNPSLVPASAPSEAEVSAAISLGQETLHGVKAASASVIGQAKKMADTANGYAERAQNVCP
jgi:hypothetical protein